MKELELCHPSSKRANHCWRLFNKKNHRCNNRTATFEELRIAFDNWEPDQSIDPVRKCYLVGDYDQQLWLSRCLLDSESMESKHIYLGLIVNCADYWCFKWVIYDELQQIYLLRTSYTDISEDNKEMMDYVSNKPLAKDKEYKIDLSTMEAGEDFWIHLRDKLFNPKSTRSKMDLQYILN